MNISFFSKNFLKKVYNVGTIFSLLILFFLLQDDLVANPIKHLKLNHLADTSKESKVDYLESIYFSGKNKDDLNVMILETLQDMEDKNGTPAVAAQYAFLSNIKSSASSAKNACDIEEMLAAGIYNLDAHEADNQKIPMPSKQTESQVAPALQAASNVSYAVGQTAYSSYYLSNGSVSSYKSGAAGYRGGAVLNEASGTAKALADAKKFFKGLGNNKPCKGVPKKNIEIGNHIISGLANEKGKTISNKAVAVSLTVTNVTFKQSESIKTNISKINHVSNIKNKSFSGGSTSMSVVTDLSISTLGDSIIIVNHDFPLEVLSESGDEDNYKLIQLSLNADAIKEPGDKKARDINISITGITYEQYKLINAQLAKKTGINSLKAGGYTANYYTTISVNTTLSADDLIEDVKSILPKLNLEVSSATDEGIMLVHTEKDK